MSNPKVVNLENNSPIPIQAKPKHCAVPIPPLNTSRTHLRAQIICQPLNGPYKTHAVHAWQAHKIISPLTMRMQPPA